MTPDVESYESHEAWLARQQEILDLVQATLDDLDGWPDEPRKLPPLPWWRDGYRMRGEIAYFFRRLGYALRNMFIVFLRSKGAPVFAFLLSLWALFAIGALMWSVTASLL
jgi:hypothetical protein